MVPAKVPHSSGEDEEDCLLRVHTNNVPEAGDSKIGITAQVHVAREAVDTTGGLQQRF